ncbi:MAG TPA: class I SAM-dependent methyltransferase [Thermoplasmata archaeon]|nr:class I SAM-dependent methyltransferase [Thermoplasmata archaeon]
MAERFVVLLRVGIEKGESVIEIGCGPHGLATIPLSYGLGARGRVVAVEIGRWGLFADIARQSGLHGRIHPVQCDASRLPIRPGQVDRAVCVHGVRSLRDEGTIIRVVAEMLRVAPLVTIAESLPIATTEAQRAHLQMYNLRAEIFEQVLGKKDDIHYFPLERLVSFFHEAGGEVLSTETFDIHLPHFLAFIPRDYVAQIRNPRRRADLLARWDAAKEGLDRYGAEHPPVAIVTARRAVGPLED